MEGKGQSGVTFKAAIVIKYSAHVNKEKVKCADG